LWNAKRSFFKITGGGKDKNKTIRIRNDKGARRLKAMND
jgi:hypothetical protein